MMSKVEDALLKMRATSADARKVFDSLRQYKVARTVTTVEVIEQKTGLKPRQVRAVLRDLQSLKLGRVWVGRRGQPTRMAWVDGALDLIPGKQPNEPLEASPLMSLPIASLKGAKAASCTAWSIRLGARRQATLLLPTGATAKEVDAVVRFCGRLLVSARAK